MAKKRDRGLRHYVNSARLKAEVEALAIKHLPHGLDSQAFYDSLEGDTELLWRVEQAGETLLELYPHNSHQKGIYVEAMAYQPRCLPYAPVHDLIGDLSPLEGELSGLLLDTSMPRRCIALPNSDSPYPKYYNMLVFLLAAMILIVKWFNEGRRSDAERALRFIVLLCLRTVPLSQYEVGTVGYRRMFPVQFLTGCLESGLVAQQFVDELVREAWESPPDWQFASQGEVVRLFSDREALDEEILSGWHGHTLGILQKSLDPQSVQAQLFAGGHGMSVGDLDFLRSCDWTSAILSSPMREQAEWELLGMDRLRRERGIEWSADPEAPAVSTWHLLWRMWWGSRETKNIGDGLKCEQLWMGKRVLSRWIHNFDLSSQCPRIYASESLCSSLVGPVEKERYEECKKLLPVRIGPDRQEYTLTSANFRIQTRRRGKRAKSRPRVRDGLLAWLVRPATPLSQ